VVTQGTFDLGVGSVLRDSGCKIWPVVPWIALDARGCDHFGSPLDLLLVVSGPTLTSMMVLSRKGPVPVLFVLLFLFVLFTLAQLASGFSRWLWPLYV